MNSKPKTNVMALADVNKTLYSNSLTVLADEVREAFGRYRQRNLAAIEAYLEVGRKLNEAKPLAGHGNWLPFLERAGVGKHTAQRAMRIARAGLKNDTVQFLGGIRAALEFSDEQLSRIAELAAERAALAAEIEALKVECDRLKAEAGDDPAVTERLDRLAAQRREIARLQAGVAAAQAARSAAERECRQLRRELRAAERERDRAEALHREIDG